jgi:ribosomal protein S18 acetylase RimI-like enzyme
LDRQPDEFRIVDIAVLPEFRGRGTGTMLLNGILAEADEAGVPVRIHVERFNPALSLYERLGFREVGDTGVYVLLERAPNGVESRS